MKYYKQIRPDISFGAHLVEGAKFTDEEEYPIIPKRMVSKIIPEKILPFDKAINYRGDLSDTFICTYCADKTFERIKRNPKKYLPFFKKTAGIIGMDYSIYTDMPIVLQKSQMYTNLALTYFYGKNGIPVIPNLRCGEEWLMPEFLKAIPKNSNVAIGTHGFIKTVPEKAVWGSFIHDFVKILHPSNIIVYGTLNGNILEGIDEISNFKYYEPWLTKNIRERKTNAIKRR